MRIYSQVRLGVTPEQAQAMHAFVRERLSAHEYPREVAFIDEMPMTTTGKVQRKLLRLREAQRAGVSS